MIYRIKKEHEDIQQRVPITSPLDAVLHEIELGKMFRERVAREGAEFNPDSLEQRKNVSETIMYLHDKFQSAIAEIDTVLIGANVCNRKYTQQQHEGMKIINFFSQGYAYFTSAERIDEKGNPVGNISGAGGMFNNGFVTNIFSTLAKQVGADSMLLILSARLMCAHYITQTLNDGSTTYENFADLSSAMERFMSQKRPIFDMAIVMINYMLASNIVFRDKNSSAEASASIPDLEDRIIDENRAKSIDSMMQLIYKLNGWGNKFSHDIAEAKDKTGNKESRARINELFRKFVDPQAPDELDELVNDILRGK